MANTKKTPLYRGRAYTNAERKDLQWLVENPVIKLNNKVFRTFCKTHNRPVSGAKAYVYKERRLLKKNMTIDIKKFKEEKQLILPLKNFQLEVKEGVTYVKFTF